MPEALANKETYQQLVFSEVVLEAIGVAPGPIDPDNAVSISGAQVPSLVQISLQF